MYAHLASTGNKKTNQELSMCPEADSTCTDTQTRYCITAMEPTPYELR